MRQHIKSVASASIVVVGLLVLPIETLAAPNPICKARLSEAEVIRIANEAAALAGFALRDFGEPTTRFGAIGDAKFCTWSVSYYGKTPTLGNHFAVFVDDRTKTTTVIPGE